MPRFLPPMLRPGPLTPSSSQELNDFLAVCARLVGGVEAQPPLSWIEDATGVHLLFDETLLTTQWTLVALTLLPISARVGNVLGSGIVLVETNNAGVLATAPGAAQLTAYNSSLFSIPAGTYVDLIWEPFSQTWFIVDSGGAGCTPGTIALVTNVCGNVVQYTTYSTPCMTATGTFCLTSPAGCCGQSGSTGVCCPGPAQLCVTLHNAANCPCLDGVSFALTYNATEGYYEGGFGLTAPNPCTPPGFGEGNSTTGAAFLICSGSPPSWGLSLQIGNEGICQMSTNNASQTGVTGSQTCSPFAVTINNLVLGPISDPDFGTNNCCTGTAITDPSQYVKLNVSIAAGACGGSGSSGSSGSGSCNAAGTSLGESSTGSTAQPSLSITNVTLPAGSPLIVCIGFVGVGGIGGVTWGSLNLTAVETVSLTFGSLFIFKGVTSSSGTNDIVAAFGGNSLVALMNAVEGSGFAGNLDVHVGGFGAATTPDAGTSGSTVAPCEYAQGAFFLKNPSAAITWGGGFTSGGQDISVVVGSDTYTLTEGFKILATATSINPKLTGLTADDWEGAGATFS